ncbi:sulfatase-like hydrolase/transferase [Zobellia laminariae]|uniref:sulfatase-like hydrolase/transferase n=1 Tax=Zobellia laminariae TaxID=248906 RepID=UPI0026F438CB|nr:sulfatase-like hydrolase/transferase [Zobellia laminariae]WKX78368.1 sulfatase-like hydrolase/transferase [Zobellia laminariae]
MVYSKAALRFLTLVLFSMGYSSFAQEESMPAKVVETVNKPNIIYILTDDLGYGDIGAFFQNQRKETDDRSEPYALTPHLDKMASEGAMLTNHYTAAPVCAPSRSSVLLGVSQAR